MNNLTWFPIAVAIATSGCDNEKNKEEIKTQTEYLMNCKTVVSGTFFIDRCENNEAICYKVKNGINCKFKELTLSL